ncbi:hypothetical protein [Natronobiforma cellulositropha]|uniref:hypothetical protein n=1 Tax=Natronobiforma cellulositropha TaxID=1679076 RepID=UPI0021D5E45C|nr:hypothetical protein [Natronobiforma cellulositropha]
MDLSPEEYGAYWRASLRIAAGVLVVVFGRRLPDALLALSEVGPIVLGIVFYVGIVLVSVYLIVLGLARVIRTAVDAEMRG